MQVSEPRVVLTWLKGCYRCNKRRWRDLSYLVTCTYLLRNTVENPRGIKVLGGTSGSRGQTHHHGNGIRNTSPKDPRVCMYSEWIKPPSIQLPSALRESYWHQKVTKHWKRWETARGNRKRWDSPAAGDSPKLLQLWLLLMQSLQDVTRRPVEGWEKGACLFPPAP